MMTDCHTPLLTCTAARVATNSTAAIILVLLLLELLLLLLELDLCYCSCWRPLSTEAAASGRCLKPARS